MFRPCFRGLFLTIEWLPDGLKKIKRFRIRGGGGYFGDMCAGTWFDALY